MDAMLGFLVSVLTVVTGKFTTIKLNTVTIQPPAESVIAHGVKREPVFYLNCALYRAAVSKI